jgi:hypothetical protein
LSVVLVQGCVGTASLVQKILRDVFVCVCVCVCVCVIVCDLDTSILGRPRTELGCTAAKELLVTLFCFDFDSDIIVLELRISFKKE